MCTFFVISNVCIKASPVQCSASNKVISIVFFFFIFLSRLVAPVIAMFAFILLTILYYCVECNVFIHIKNNDFWSMMPHWKTARKQKTDIHSSRNGLWAKKNPKCTICGRNLREFDDVHMNNCDLEEIVFRNSDYYLCPSRFSHWSFLHSKRTHT